MTLKHCSRCNQDLSVISFNKDLRKPNRLMSRCKTCRDDQSRVWRRSNPNYETQRYWHNPASHRERHLVRKYGINLSDYDAMFVRQLGCCAVCGKKQDRAFDVDHCHASKIVRGLLCTNCNRMIGHSADSPERLRKAADYLESCRKSRSKSSRSSESK